MYVYICFIFLFLHSRNEWGIVKGIAGGSLPPPVLGVHLHMGTAFIHMCRRHMESSSPI